MRVPDPSPRSRPRAFTVIAWLLLASTAAAQAPATPPPALATLSLSGFDRFELADVQLAADLPAADANEPARRELQMHLRDRLGPWLSARNAQPASGQRRTVRIEPAIVVLGVVDPGVRLAVGPWVGTGQLHVRVRFVDVAKGEAIAEVLLRADGSGLTPVSSLDAAAPALPRRIADALADYLDSWESL